MFSVTFALRLDPLLPSSQTRVQIADYENQIKQTENSLKQAMQGAEIEVRKIIIAEELLRA